MWYSKSHYPQVNEDDMVVGPRVSGTVTGCSIVTLQLIMQSANGIPDNIKEWTGLEFTKSQRAVENRNKIGETGCEVIRGAPLIPVVPSREARDL